MSKYSYKQVFLDLGFASIKDHGAEKPQCVLCYKVLSYESLKKNKLKRHLETKHPQHVKNNRIFFQHRETELIQSRICSDTNPALLAFKQATLALYVVSLRIAREMKPHIRLGKGLLSLQPLTWPDSCAATAWPRNCSPSRYRTTQSKAASLTFH